MLRTNFRRGQLRGSRLSSRPFYVTVLILSLLTAYSFLARTQYRAHDDSYRLLTRSDKPDCHEVHGAEDQCAFIKQYCVDDDAGLLPYLDLYYCGLGHAQPVAFVILVLWLGMLFTTIGIAASDFFSVNLSTIATILGLSESLAGVTFLAFGNGSPDVFSTFAAMGSNSASMAVGELIGAASFIAGVVAGSMALVREFRVDRKTYARDICFFIVAVAFTMVFLADGHLHLWECCAMIGYYVIYVTTVVGWHWYSSKRKQRMRREGEARSHVYGPAGHASDELAGEPYRDDPDDVDNRQPYRDSPDVTDISALEAGPRIEVDGREPNQDDDEDAEEDHDKMVAAEVASSMRVLRGRGKRSSTITPIRPSLVGALEFRSALAQLQREGNVQLSMIPGRSYSENHIYGRGRSGSTSEVPDGAARSANTISVPDEAVAKRERALSSGNQPARSLIPPELSISQRERAESNLTLPQQSAGGARTPSPTPSYVVGGSLAPPPIGSFGTSTEATGHEGPVFPKLNLQIPSRRSSHSDLSSPSSPFPHYTDSPMPMTPNIHADPGEFVLPAPARRDSPFTSLHISSEQPKPVRWWPYAVLPPPHLLLATLFPTLQGWSEKTHWDRFVSAISVPSIFLLVITLPVVESETNEATSLADGIVNPPSRGSIGHVAPPISIEPDSIHPDPETEWQRYRRRTLSRTGSLRSLHDVSPGTVSPEHEATAAPPARHNGIAAQHNAAKPMSDVPSISNANGESASWNRWLVCLQLFTGPIFAVFILWANMLEDWEDPGKSLAMMVLYTLVGSLVMLGVLLLFTTESRRPEYHFLLCFLGFIISIAWISTIAGEVVGVLKTFGVVLNISEALLGLTIFAAGNSVGDLIADITVARLGYPVMALSACFGGPMLNILLGIGIGGVLMMVQAAKHRSRKHPDQPYRYEPYRVQVGGTLMISAITLLVMLVALLIAVPMNKWILSRKIGWSLIALWSLSTIVNVIVELTGVWGELA